MSEYELSVEIFGGDSIESLEESLGIEGPMGEEEESWVTSILEFVETTLHSGAEAVTLEVLEQQPTPSVLQFLVFAPLIDDSEKSRTIVTTTSEASALLRQKLSDGDFKAGVSTSYMNTAFRSFATRKEGIREEREADPHLEPLVVLTL